MAESRQEARRIITELARAVDRKLTVEVRDIPGQERVQVALQHGTHQSHIELAIPAILAAGEDAVARNELRLRIKRATDTMLFRTPPDHRLAAVKSVAPPGGQTSFRSPRGRGGRR
jgi:hypothetical protein